MFWNLVNKLKKLKNKIKLFFNTKKKKILFSLLLILLIIIPLSFFFLKKQASASWWDEAWHYRKSIPLTNSSGSTLTDFQIKVLTNYDLSADVTASKIQSDLDDLRFTNSSGIVLDYWIEDSTNNSVDIWIKNPSLINGSSTIYMYYGNPQAIAYSDGNKVFDFFDDFSIFDSTRWGVTGDYNLANGKMTVTTGSVYSKNTVATTPQNKTIEMKAKYLNNVGLNDDYSGINIAEANGTNFSNADAQALVYSVTQSGGSSNDLTAWASDGNSTGYGLASGPIIYTPSLNTDYISGYTFQGTSNINFFLKDLSYANLGSTTPSGTWNYPFYLWFGGYRGSNMGTWNVDDLEVDWVRVRKYASTQPTTGTFGTEEKSPAPVGYWSFDEGYGTVAHDESSNKNNGTITGATWKNESECVSGKCLNFNGSSSYVSIADNPQISGGHDVSVGIWFKAKSTSGTNESTNPLITKYQDTSVKDWGLTLVGNKLSFVFEGAGANNWDISVGLYGTTTIEPSKWYYASFVYNDITKVVKIYLDGKEEGSATLPVGLPNSVANAEVGRAGYKNYYFNGDLDEPKIYDYARTADQIKADFAAGSAGQGKISEGASATFGSKSESWLTDGLVGYWKMDETSWNGTTNEVIDASGNSNHGVASGGATTAGGKFGSGGSFDAVDDFLNMGSNESLDNLTSFTWSAWINPKGNPENNKGILYFKGAGSTMRKEIFLLPISGSDEFKISANLYTDNVSATSTSNTFTYTLNEWQLFLVTYNNLGDRKIHIYKNGQEVSYFSQIAATGNVLDDATYDSYIGSDNNGFYSHNGQIDETRIYNRTLSPDEIKQLYSYAPGPVLHLKMDEKTGTTAYDSSGNNNHGTLANSPVWETGKINGGVDFLKTQGKIDLPNTILKGMSQTTISAWVYKSSFASSFAGAWGFSASAGEWLQLQGLRLGSATEVIVYTGTQGADAQQDYFALKNYLGRWTYLSVVTDYPTSKVILYQDGIKIGEVINTYNATSIENINHSFSSIGKFRDMPEWLFDGKIDDFKIYNYARTQEQILEDMSASGGGALKSPVLDYGFDEGRGTTAYNKGNPLAGGNGTLNSGGSGSNFNQTMMWEKGGKFGGAMEFDGTNDLVELGNVSNLNSLSSQTTISAWVYVKSDIGDHWVFSRSGTASDSGFHLWADDVCANGVQGMGNTNTFSFNIGSTSVAGNRVNGPSGIRTLNQWHHIVGVMDGNSRKLYHNGELIASHNSGVKTTIDSTSDLSYLGYSLSNADKFDGLIDEVKIYNYALGEDEIKTLYNGGASLSMGGGSASANNNGTTVTGDSAKYCVPGDSAKCDKPVMELKLDEKSGTTAYDTSGNGNNGTLTGGPIWERGKNGGAINFGNNNYINISDNASLRPGTGDFTAGFWIKTPFAISGTGSWPSIFIKGVTTSAPVNTWGFVGSNTSTNTVRFHQVGDTSGSFEVSMNTPALSNGWHFIVARRVGTTTQLYADGKFIIENITAGSNLSSSSDIRIGGDFSNGGDFIGSIDQPTYYNYARTPSQIAWDYNQGKPIAQWKFDEGEGTVAHDESGSGFNGTLTNMDAATDWVNGKNNKALDFDGTNDFVSVGQTVSGYPLTLSAWVKPNYTNVSGAAVFVGPTYQIDGCELYFKNDGYAYAKVNGTETAKLPYVAGEWQHIVGVFTSSTSRQLYINGESSIIETTNRTPSSWGNTWIGKDYDWGDNKEFNGQIDDVKIYNYALTPLQVKMDYNNSSAVNFR